MRRVLVQLLLKSLSQDEAISFIDVVYKCENKKQAPYMTHYCRVVTDIYIQLKVVSHTIMTDFFYFVIGVSLQKTCIISPTTYFTYLVLL